MALNSVFAFSSPLGCVSGIAKDFHVSEEAAGLVTTMLLLGYCTGPVFWAPLSDRFLSIRNRLELTITTGVLRPTMVLLHHFRLLFCAQLLMRLHSELRRALSGKNTHRSLRKRSDDQFSRSVNRHLGAC